MTNPAHYLAPLTEHPELKHLDDAGCRTWAEAHNLTLHRDWRGKLATTLEDAYKLRSILDADNLRQAEQDNARMAALSAEADAALAPLLERLARQGRRAQLMRELEGEAPVDGRVVDWDARMTELGDARFIPDSIPQVDTRTPLERLMAQRSNPQ